MISQTVSDSGKPGSLHRSVTLTDITHPVFFPLNPRLSHLPPRDTYTEDTKSGFILEIIESAHGIIPKNEPHSSSHLTRVETRKYFYARTRPRAFGSRECNKKWMRQKNLLFCPNETLETVSRMSIWTRQKSKAPNVLEPKWAGKLAPFRQSSGASTGNTIFGPLLSRGMKLSKVSLQ